jgi:hypothetical protein
MEGLGGVVFLLVMGIVWMLSQVFQHRRRAPAQPPASIPEKEPSQTDAVRVMERTVRPDRIRQRAESRAERLRDLRKADAAPETHIAARRLVMGRENLRRAVIVMTVLGPPVSQRPSTTWQRD